MSEDEASQEETFLYSGKPIMPAGQSAGPADSMKILAAAGPAIEKAMALTGKDKFEHMLLYCLTLLHPSNGIAAFYLEDFDDCDEHTLRLVQSLIARCGYVVSDFTEPKTKKYKGFWAWKAKG